MRRRTPRGITTIEVIIVLGLLVILAVIGLPFTGSFGQRNDLFAAQRGLVHALRRAQLRAVLSEGGSNVWVRIVSGTGTDYTVFRGTSYAARDTDTEDVYAFPDTVGVTLSFPNASSTLDLAFSRYDGRPSATGTFRLYSNIGGTSTIQVGPQGQITAL